MSGGTLVWAMIDGELRPVSRYARTSPRLRPQAFCPGCEQPVTLKLGGSNRHHFAHRADLLCPATNPETALHFNAKLHLARELESGSKLRLPRHCVGIAGKSRRERG
jgi:hypothetical protein